MGQKKEKRRTRKIVKAKKKRRKTKKKSETVHDINAKPGKYSDGRPLRNTLLKSEICFGFK